MCAGDSRHWLHVFFGVPPQGDNLPAQVIAAFQSALGRVPDAEELKSSIAFVRAGGASGLASFCHALFNLNEFVYRP